MDFMIGMQMKDHGGFITVESGVGKGASFGLYFPQEPLDDNP